MNPPTEQLVRDYLNRLSLAARSRLGLSDRQALLDQTRARIEAEVGSLSHATPAQVRQTLAALGDPIVLVESSRFGGLANGAARQIWPHGAGVAHAPVLAGAGAGAAAAAGAGTGPAFDLQVPGRLPVTGGISVPASVSFSDVPPGPSAGSPAAGGSLVPVSSPAAVGAPVPPVSSSISVGLPPPDGPSVPAARRAPGSQPGPGSQPAPGSQLASGSPSVPSPAGPSPSPESLAGAPVPPPPPDGSESDGPDESDTGVEFSIWPDEPARREGASRWLSSASSTAADRISRVGSGLVALALRDRLETIALVLLAIGGAVYPPIWLVGALIAISSRKWDLRDKWLGLAVPVLLVIFGAVLVMVLGGERPSIGSYAFEAWLAAGRLSRIAAVLGAGYLLGRVYRGKREPKRPPWSTPRSR